MRTIETQQDNLELNRNNPQKSSQEEKRKEGVPKRNSYGHNPFEKPPYPLYYDLKRFNERFREAV